MKIKVNAVLINTDAHLVCYTLWYDNKKYYIYKKYKYKYKNI